MHREFAITLVMLFLNQEIITNVASSPSEWKTIESLAEGHPYIVAILNDIREYVCTGTIIDRRTVLTSGGCIIPEPHYVAVGTAILTKVNNRSVFEVAFVKLHNDYIFELQESEPHIPRMHSNIGLVFMVKPVLEYFIESAIIGNFYASELKDKKLTMVGFGGIKTSEGFALQRQAYHQIACQNPKWYYCVCGLEYALATYDEPFGEGAPVLYRNEVVGIAVRSSGTLVMKSNINYNIFTVVGPYLAWIDKTKFESLLNFRANPINDARKLYSVEVYFCLLFIIFVKLLI